MSLVTRIRRAAALLAALSLWGPAGCAIRHGAAPDEPLPSSGGPFEDAWDLFTVSEAPPSPAARVFLFAGSSQNANFAQEVVDQRHMWLEAGVPDEAIACFYVPPYQEELEADYEQYVSLAEALSRCHLATVPALRRHLAAAAEGAGGGDALYLYVTSHGAAPADQRLATLQRGDPGYWNTRRLSRYEPMNRHRIAVEAMEDGPAGPMELLGALRLGGRPEDLYLTPDTLRAMLDDGWANQPKIVVLQACYSGGFIADPADPRPEERLTALTNITILTAARYDRASFGCGGDDHTTYFGGFLGDVLTEHPALPAEQDWRSVFADTAYRVEELERLTGQEPPSLPGFYSDR